MVTPESSAALPAAVPKKAAGARDRALYIVLLVVLTLPAYLFVGRQFDRVDVYNQYNVLYNADPLPRIACFAAGWGGRGRAVVHPNLCNIINPLVRVLALPLEWSGLLQPPAARRAIALTLVPVSASLALCLVFASFCLFGCPPGLAFVFTLLYAFSFSQLIFASIPEHFALGGASLALTLWLFARGFALGDLRVLPWTGAGALVLSITVTNFLLFLLIMWIGMVTLLPLAQAVRRVLAITSLALLAVLAVKLPMDTVYAWRYARTMGRPLPGFQITQYYELYKQDHPLSTLALFPGTVLASYVAPEISVPAQRKGQTERGTVQFSFREGGVDYRAPIAIASAIGVAAMIMIALAVGYRQSRRGIPHDRALFFAAAGVLAFNGLLHAVWGSEYFLYSQHWLPATTLALALLGRPSFAGARALLPVAAITTLFVVLVNVRALASMFDVLRGAM